MRLKSASDENYFASNYTLEVPFSQSLGELQSMFNIKEFEVMWLVCKQNKQCSQALCLDSRLDLEFSTKGNSQVE